MTEARFAARVASRLRGLGAFVQRIESPGTGGGTPDLFYAARGVEGWVELKALDGWPKRSETAVRVGFRPLQPAWLRSCGRAGSGRCWVLARVGRGEHLLWRWDAVEELATGVPQGAARKYATAAWGRLDYSELLDVLT